MTGISTNLIHGADHLARVHDVIQPINVTTTYKYDEDPEKLVKVADWDFSTYDILDKNIYSRLTHPSSQQVEAAIEKITGGYVVAYNSGLSAFFAALTHFNPKVLSIGKGYHGCHSIANIFTRNSGLKQISLDDDFSQLGEGDVVHLETPVNPEGTALNIKMFADKAHARGAILMVDATFAPPPLLDPFAFGADIIMHSATKFFGGHSDLLAGLLITKDKKVRNRLLDDRIYLGTNIANLESAMLVRSLKTYELRITKQSENAAKLVKFLVDNRSKFPALGEIYHSSLQEDQFVKEQLPNGHSPIFSLSLVNEQLAKSFPSNLKYFHHATSLGGVESLIEWRALSDFKVDPTLLRVSVGVENIEDLIADFASALSTGVENLAI